MYGHTWASQYGTAAAGVAAKTWAASLAGVTPEQLAVGLRACVAEGNEFPPNAPRFRAMCFGIPSLDRVSFELRKPDTASRFSRAVWQFINGYRYGKATEEDRQRMIKSAYGLARDAVMRGEPLPEEPVANLAAPEPRKPNITPGFAEKSLETIARILEPTPAERLETARKEAEQREAKRIAAELARRGNEPAVDDPAKGL
ncbi:hypothetical protein [Lysobacter sp. CA199]|uniref:hypothetical protein n=1 Tax=Lysobacter sp. CA199 TaxID=3455608 RepID=UPI003F8D1054